MSRKRFKKGDLVIIKEGSEIQLNQWYHNSCVCSANLQVIKGNIGEIIYLSYKNVENIWKIKIPITATINFVIDIPESLIRKLPEYKHG
jgi:hypothetical protein